MHPRDAALERARRHHQTMTQEREQRDLAILDAYEADASYRDIARAIGASKTIAVRVVHEFGEPRPAGARVR